MLIAVPSETVETERRVALVPEAVKKLSKIGLSLKIESGAGLKTGYSDQEYVTAGAEIEQDRNLLLAKADIVLRVQKPAIEDIDLMKTGCIQISYLDPYNEPAL